MSKNLLFLRIPILFLLLLITLTAILFTTPAHLNELFYNLIFNKQLFAIIFTLALIILTYIWSVKLLNGWWALLPPFLLTFSPTILNQYSIWQKPLLKKLFNLNHYQSYTLTADIATALFFTATIYYLMKFLLKPSKWHLFLTGLNFGLAQLTGFPALILIPYFLILISIFYIAGIKRNWLATEPLARLKRFGIRGFRYFRSIIVIFIIGFLLVYIYYALTYTFEYIQIPEGSEESAFIAAIPNYFRDISKELNSNYHPLLISLIKTHLPFIILIASAFIYSLIGIIKSFRISKFKGFWDYLGTSFPEFSMIVFTIIYGGFVIFTNGFNINKLIPILPMVYILTASGLKKLVNVR